MEEESSLRAAPCKRNDEANYVSLLCLIGSFLSDYFSTRIYFHLNEGMCSFHWVLNVVCEDVCNEKSILYD